MTKTFTREELEIMLDALALVHNHMKQRESFGLINSKSYSLNDVDNLYLDLHASAPYFGRLSKELNETNR